MSVHDGFLLMYLLFALPLGIGAVVDEVIRMMKGGK